MAVPADHQRFAWVTLEAQEIIELKEAIMDRDSHDVVDFFLAHRPTTCEGCCRKARHFLE